MKIAVIGCGNMGMAYVHSFVKQGIVNNNTLLLIEKLETKKKELEILNIGTVTNEINHTISSYDYVIIAVKPQDFTTTASEVLKFRTKDQVFISIMAGITISKIADLLETNKVVRAMPNTPAQINMGVTAYASTNEISESELKM